MTNPAATVEVFTDLDPAVLDRARAGDESAAELLVRHYDPGLRLLAFRLLGDRDRMDDALQEAYVRVFRALPAFRGESRLGTWLYRIAYNACLDELGRTRKLVRLSFEEPDEQPDPGAYVEAEVAGRHALAQALRELALEERAAVLLVDGHGFTYDEAAAVLGVPAGTIGSRLNRARARLRLALRGPVRGAIER